MNDLISVVVPIYKVEDYLAKCIESIAAQSYTNIEIILVDDGSPDHCPEICDEYSAQDARIKVIHKENGGLSDARNAGLAIAEGKYVAFVDSDDYITPDFIQELHRICIEDNSDISCCNFSYVDESGLTKASKSSATRMTFTNIEAIRDIFLANSCCEVMTWNKLYRRSLFTDNAINFPVGMIHEDTLTTYKLFFFADKISYTDQSMYRYLQRSGSIMSQKFNVKRLDLLCVFDEAKEFFSLNNVKIDDELQSFRLLVTLGLLNSYLASSEKDEEISRVLTNELRSMDGILRNKLITGKHKVLYLMARTNAVSYGLIRSLYESRKAS